MPPGQNGQTGHGVGALVGGEEGAQVGGPVLPTVGGLVGEFVGASVGEAVGARVGARVGGWQVKQSRLLFAQQSKLLLKNAKARVKLAGVKPGTVIPAITWWAI